MPSSCCVFVAGLSPFAQAQQMTPLLVAAQAEHRGYGLFPSDPTSHPQADRVDLAPKHTQHLTLHHLDPSDGGFSPVLLNGSTNGSTNQPTNGSPSSLPCSPTSLHSGQSDLSKSKSVGRTPCFKGNRCGRPAPYPVCPAPRERARLRPNLISPPSCLPCSHQLA